MKSVMLSVQRPYCELMAIRDKTLEIRKTCPKLGTPFLCYIYCTKERLPWLDLKTEQRMDGFVIGEFVCDRIRGFDVPNPMSKDKIDKSILEESCLRYWDLYKYAHRRKLYGWHITGMTVYKKPLPLTAFGIERAPQSFQ